MKYELTESQVARQNMLNNQYALEELSYHLEFEGVTLDDQTLFTKPMVADLLDVDVRTIDRYIARFGDELKANGYQIIKGKVLKDLKKKYVDDINVVDILLPKLLPGELQLPEAEAAVQTALEVDTA